MTSIPKTGRFSPFFGHFILFLAYMPTPKLTTLALACTLLCATALAQGKAMSRLGFGEFLYEH